MPTGLFKTSDQSVQVDYDGVSIPIPRSTYENNGYKPDFDNLPLEAEYRAAKEKLGKGVEPIAELELSPFRRSIVMEYRS